MDVILYYLHLHLLHFLFNGKDGGIIYMPPCEKSSLQRLGRTDQRSISSEVGTSEVMM